MDDVPAEMRANVLQWVQQGQAVLPHLLTLLHTNDSSARITTLEQEGEKLRQQIGSLMSEVDRLRADLQRSQAEHDEIARELGKFLDSVQPMNQIAQRLGVRKSVFERLRRTNGSESVSA
jgi:chromosome segregation ATPase